MVDYGIPIGKLFFVGALSVILTIDVIVGLQALYFWQLERTETVDVLYQQPADLKKIDEAQRAGLAEYRVTDPEKKTVSIPITRAMDLVVKELSASQSSVPSSQGDVR